MNFEVAADSTDETPVNREEPGTDTERPRDSETSVNEASEEQSQLVSLQWVPEGDDPLTTVPVAIEANSQMIAELSEANGSHILDHELETVQTEVHDCHEKQDELKKRIHVIERRQTQVIDRLNHLSTITRMLLTVSAVASTGTCPECENAPLEVKTRIGKANRVACANTDCGHIAATLE